MSKKDLVNKFFENEAKITVPAAKSNTKKYPKRKLFESPDSPVADSDNLMVSDKGEVIIEIDPDRVYVSPNKVDRINIDNATLEEIAQTMQEVGQVQPCIVRRSNEVKGKDYELLFGERRFKAALFKGLKLKVTVKEMNDHDAALQLLAENKGREDNTDYELYLQISKCLETGSLTKSDLTSKLGFSKQRLFKLLSFEKIPDELLSVISDLSKVSAMTAECLVRLCKDENNMPYLYELADKIMDGSLGHTKISAYVDKRKRSKKDLNVFESNKVYDKSGRHIFTWRKDNNDAPSIHFPRDVVKLMEHKQIDMGRFTQKIRDLVNDELDSISTTIHKGSELEN